MPPRIRQGRSLTQLSGAARLPSIDRFASRDRTAGGGPTRRLRPTHHERGHRMTRPNQRATSERHAPHRSEPVTVPAAIWLTRQAVLSIPTLRLHCPMFHRKRISEYRGDTATTMALLARYEHRGQAGDGTSMRLIGTSFPNECGGEQKGSPAAINPVAAPGTTALFNITPFRPRGRGRHGTAVRTR
jgi:hypothetical protein